MYVSDIAWGSVKITKIYSGRDHGKKIRLKETGCKRRASARCLAHVHLRSRRFVRKVWIGVIPRTTFVVQKVKRPERNEYRQIRDSLIITKNVTVLREFLEVYPL